MSIHTNAGTRVFISPVPIDVDAINDMTDADAIEFFQEIADWIEVEELEDTGEFGDTAESITFTALNNARVRKLKGPRDAGTQTIVAGRDPLDDGQEAFITAEKTSFNYAVKQEFSDARTPEYTNSEIFYGGLVMGAPTNAGNVSNVVRRTFTVGINTAVYELISAEIVEGP